MEQNNSLTLDDHPLNVYSVSPYPNSRPEVHVSDRDKAGATLLFSGIFLGLVGITFTVMGWIKREGFDRFEWTQLLGPILLSVGVTFALISVCKFKLLSCRLCKSNEEPVIDGELSPGSQSFVFTGINQPITFHGATVVQYIPPPYTAQDVVAMNSISVSPVPNARNTSVGNGATLPLCPPQYHSIYPMDNPAFIEDDVFLAEQATDNGYERSPDAASLPQDFQGENLPRDPPPLYCEIYPEMK
ncbi:transmembrane protein 174 [Pelodytes ibericus]